MHRVQDIVAGAVHYSSYPDDLITALCPQQIEQPRYPSAHCRGEPELNTVRVSLSHKLSVACADKILVWRHDMLAGSETFQNVFPGRLDPSHRFDHEFDLRITGNIIYIRRDNTVQMLVSLPAVSGKDLYHFQSARIQSSLICAASDGTESHDSYLHPKFLLSVIFVYCTKKGSRLLGYFPKTFSPYFVHLHKKSGNFFECSVPGGQSLYLCPRYENTCLCDKSNVSYSLL